MTPTTTVTGFSLAFLAAITWAVAPVFYRRAIDHVSYYGLGAIRCIGYIVSAGAFLLVTMGAGSFSFPGIKLFVLVFICSNVWLVLGDFLYFASLHRLGVSLCVPITSAYPLLAVPASWIFLKAPFNSMVLVAAILIVLGVILLSHRTGSPEHLTPSVNGISLAFLTMCCWTFGIITNRFLLDAIPAPQLEWWRAVSVTTGSWVLFMVMDNIKDLKRLSLRNITEMSLAGALGLAVGNLLFTYSFKFISVDIATCIASSRPFIASLFAFFILKERLTRIKVAGISLVTIGIILISL
ncbi:DMT family transporter [Thermovirga sp.]|uniref:DMT family transporter n=1 Tax=Thermovirga sp. TaxID=2699834 RepID=UPI0025D0BB94|nr:DMT family transporter [Thermovirga sp.]MBO8153893.1 DMT family transporter [Thermovirga sp.]